MQSRPKRSSAVHTVKRLLADGTTKEYRYARRRQKRQVKAPNSIHALLDAYQGSPEWKKLAPATKTQYEIYLRPLWLAKHVAVADVQRRDLLAVRNRISKERGDGAAHGFVRAVSALFTWAVDAEWIQHTPATRLAKGLTKGHLRAWTQEEAAGAIKHLPEHLRRVVVLALYTGQRRGDLCSLTWAAFDGEHIKLRQQKTGAEMVIPCHPTLCAELLVWKYEARSLTILADANGKPWKPNLLSHYLPDALVRIGLSNEINVHGLRKLAAANLAEAGCSTNEIAAITGHRTLSMVQLYTASADQRRLAGAAIIRLVGKRVVKGKKS